MMVPYVHLRVLLGATFCMTLLPALWCCNRRESQLTDSVLDTGRNAGPVDKPPHRVRSNDASSSPQALVAMAAKVMNQRGDFHASSQLHARVATLGLADLRSLIDASSAGSTDGDRLLLSIAVERLADTSPREALDLITALPPEQFPFGHQSIIDVATNRDPALVAQWLESVKCVKADGRQDQQATMQLFYAARALAKVDPDAGKAAIDASTGIAKAQLIAAFYASLGGADPQRALELARGSLSGGDLESALQAAARGIGRGNPALALQVLSEVSNNASRWASQRRLMEDWFQKDPAAAVAGLQDLPDADLGKALGDSFIQSQVVKCDVAGALQLLDKLPPTESNTAIFESVLAHASVNDAGLVTKWLQDLPPGQAKDRTVASIYSSWSLQDPAAAAALIGDIDQGQRPSALRGLSNGWAAGDWNAALHWSAQLAAPERHAFVSQLLRAAALADPQGAAESVFTGNPNNAMLTQEDRAAVVEQAAATLAQRDLQQAATWAIKVPAAYQPAAVRALMGRWVKDDAAAAGAWLQTLPPGEPRNTGVRVLQNELIRADPEAARQWGRLLTQ